MLAYSYWNSAKVLESGSDTYTAHALIDKLGLNFGLAGDLDGCHTATERIAV